MDRFLHVRWWRIIIWIVIFTASAFGLWVLDIVWLQKNPIVWLHNYSDVVLTIWEMQTTIASLILASAAFILGKIDNCYYGISIKNLLHLSRHCPKIELSFWEKIVCSIIVPIITWFFVVLNNITAASFLLLFTVYLATSILVECINVITKSEIYSEWAKQVVNQLINTITTSAKKNKSIKEAAKKQLCVVINEIDAEVSSEIRRGADLYENATYCYIVRLLDRYTNEEMVQFNEQMHSTLIEWLRLAITVKAERNIRTLLRASCVDELNSRWSSTGVDVFMHAYYRGDISASCFHQEINRIADDILQAYNDYTANALHVLRNAIYYADANTFSKIIKAVWRSSPYDKPEIKSNVLIIAVAYLYYMAFKEQYMPIEKGSHYLEALRAFSETTIMESYGSSTPQTITDILSDPEEVFLGAEFLLKFFDDHTFNWEYISLGEAKAARLGNDTIEFLTFYCYLFFSNIHENDLEQIPLNALIKMADYMNLNGIIKDEHTEKYITFCKWLGKEEESAQENEWFYTSLIAAIKEKMIAEAKIIREKREIWTTKIQDMKTEIIDHASKSELFIDNIPSKDSCVNLRICQFLLLKDFSEHVVTYGNEQIVRLYIESKLFHKLFRHNILNRCGVKKSADKLEESILAFEEMRHQMLNMGVNVDQSYNRAFWERFSYRRIPPLVSEKIHTLNSTIRNVGQWDTGYSNVSVYADSTLASMGFSFPNEGFMTVIEQLTDPELRYVCQRYKIEDSFLFKESSNSVEIPFTEDELIEYLRVAMIKIRYSFPAKLPRRKIGFVTFYN